MSDVVALLDGSGVGEELVGGKAASLDRLIAVGAPVPPTGAITTTAYMRFIEAPALSALLDELRSAPIPEPAAMEAETARVDSAFLGAPMPDDLAAAIAELAASVAGDGLLAVRSSATAEDLGQASFAGQYRSFLEVKPADVERAVRLTWASLWAPAPRSYRRFRGIAEDDLAMAVIVMRLVHARHAGVVFTADPGGRPDHMRIEIVEGLGEQLVSGRVTPDAYVVPRAGSRDVPAARAAIMDELVDLAAGIEERFGRPQDIEWAHDGERLYLVQARPITADALALGDDDGFDTPPIPGHTYTSEGIAEMLPGVLPPLLWTINGPLLEEAFRRMFDELGLAPDDLVESQAIVARIRGRAALNIDILKRVAEAMPGGSGEELERQYFGEVITPPSEKSEPPKRFRAIRTLLPSLRAIALRRRLGREAAVVIRAARDVVGLQTVIHTMDPVHLLAYRRRVRELAARAIAAETAVAAAAVAAYRGLELFLEPHVGAEEVARLAQDLTAGGIDVCGVSAALDVCSLVGEALTDPTLEDALTSSSDAERIIESLRATEPGRAFLRRFSETVRNAGSAAVFGGPNWEEAEGVALNALKQAVAFEQNGARPAMNTDRTVALRSLEERLTRGWKWRTTRVMTGQVVDVRKRLLRRLVADAVEFLGLRERTKAAVLNLGGESRRIIRRIAHLLVERHLLERANDVDYLADHELEDALAGYGPSHEVIARRRRIYANAQGAGPLPQRFTGRPEPIAPTVADGGDLTGWAASPGRHRGRARVVTELATANLQRGDVLVARTTDPSWTPLFLTAGAIVVEQGGPLSHAAIVARELGLPAVLNARGATARLAGEPEVTVDGSAGTVLVHGEKPEEDAA